jgi:hypothetical protein
VAKISSNTANTVAYNHTRMAAAEAVKYTAIKGEQENSGLLLHHK